VWSEQQPGGLAEKAEGRRGAAGEVGGGQSHDEPPFVDRNDDEMRRQERVYNLLYRAHRATECRGGGAT